MCCQEGPPLSRLDLIGADGRIRPVVDSLPARRAVLTSIPSTQWELFHCFGGGVLSALAVSAIFRTSEHLALLYAFFGISDHL